MRQPKYLTSKPVRTAAAAMPRLPTSPLTPITAPGRVVCCTSIGNADRMVDRSERAHERQRGGELPRVLRRRRRAGTRRRCRTGTRASSPAGPSGRPGGRPAPSPGRTARRRRSCTASGLPSARSRSRRAIAPTAVAKISSTRWSIACETLSRNVVSGACSTSGGGGSGRARRARRWREAAWAADRRSKATSVDRNFTRMPRARSAAGLA